MKYGYVGPPFNFLGHLNQSQWTAFKAWIEAQEGDAGEISLFYRVRAQQLRKTAGMLEKYYSEYHLEELGPTFQKSTWQPGPDGYFGYSNRNDHEPMVIMSKIKDRLREKLQNQDESVFAMNNVRTLIERAEDSAQLYAEAQTDLPELLSNIDNLFNQPKFQASLVKDQKDQYKGEERFRVHPFDPPTAWEKDLTNRTIQR